MKSILIKKRGRQKKNKVLNLICRLEKYKEPVEFGAKLDLSMDGNGIARLAAADLVKEQMDKGLIDKGLIDIGLLLEPIDIEKLGICRTDYIREPGNENRTNRLNGR